MASVNKVIIVGNLGADPDVKTFDNGGKIANISVATTDRWTDRNTGEQREATEWHRITFSDRLADIVAQYLRKGSSVYVEGSLRTRKWQDPQTGQDRYATEIRATSMQMLGSRQGGHDGYQGGGYQNNYQGNPQGGYNRPQGNAQGYPQNNFANAQNNYPQNNFANAPQSAPQNFNQGGQMGNMGGYDNYSQEQNFAPPAPVHQAPPANNFGSPSVGNANTPKPMTGDTPAQINDDDMPF